MSELINFLNIIFQNGDKSSIISYTVLVIKNSLFMPTLLRRSRKNIYENSHNNKKWLQNKKER